MGIESGGIVLALNEVRAERDRLRDEVERLRSAIGEAVQHLENGMAASAMATLDDALPPKAA